MNDRDNCLGILAACAALLLVPVTIDAVSTTPFRDKHGHISHTPNEYVPRHRQGKHFWWDEINEGSLPGRHDWK